MVLCTEPNAEAEEPNYDIQLMAEDYLRMGIVKANKMSLPTAYVPEEEISKDVLVIGGGDHRSEGGPGSRQGRV